MMSKQSTKPDRKAFWLGWGLAAGVAGIAIYHRRVAAERTATWNQKMRSAEKEMSPTALVTGASSGIGAVYARALARQGYHLVLVARRVDRLQALAVELEELYGTRVEILTADLSRDRGIASVERRIAAGEAAGDDALPPIDFLVNNAGYDVFGSFVEIAIKKHLDLINCMELAVVRLTHATLPGMLKRGRGAIVNVSSMGSFIAKPYDAIYVATKSFLNLFSESLATEIEGSGVRIQALCPGFTRTEFHDIPELAKYNVSERLPFWLWSEPESVVEASLRGIAEDRRLVVPGLVNQLIVLGGRLGLSSMLIGIMVKFLRR